MHENEFKIGDLLVRQLVDSQFPEWRTLGLERVASSGTVHAMYRLGDEYALRLPRSAEFSAALEREAKILPALRGALPIPIPELAAIGEATDEYPSTWTILRWIEGRPMTQVRPHYEESAAARLGNFAAAIRSVQISGNRSSNQRGRHLNSTDEWTRESIHAISDEFDADVLTDGWNGALSARSWDGTYRWIHGDLLPANLLVRAGELSAVIDFGECALGNPTCDLVAGWWVFDGTAREVFRQASGADSDAWNRARGWALSGAAGALAYYRKSNPEFAEQARTTLARVVAELAAVG